MTESNVSFGLFKYPSNRGRPKKRYKKEKRKKETMFINSKHTKASNGKSGLSSMRRAD